MPDGRSRQPLPDGFVAAVTFYDEVDRCDALHLPHVMLLGQLAAPGTPTANSPSTKTT